jgi:CheY-like chemotaxis protein
MYNMTNILLVEDNIGFRELFREHLKERSLNVKLIEANDPIEGLQLLTKYKYNFDISQTHPIHCPSIELTQKF